MPPEFTTALLLLGSNVNALDNLRAAVRLLRASCEVLAVSSVYRTQAVGETSGGMDYLNAAVQVQTTHMPADFKRDVLRRIEDALGRDRAQRAVVPIDMDIAIWGDTPTMYGEKPWQSPSPDVTRYAFAAVPLAEIAPEVVVPGTGETLAQVAAQFASDGIVRVGTINV